MNCRLLLLSLINSRVYLYFEPDKQSPSYQFHFKWITEDKFWVWWKDFPVFIFLSRGVRILPWMILTDLSFVFDWELCWETIDKRNKSTKILIEIVTWCRIGRRECSSIISESIDIVSIGTWRIYLPSTAYLLQFLSSYFECYRWRCCYCFCCLAAYVEGGEGGCECGSSRRRSPQPQPHPHPHSPTHTHTHTHPPTHPIRPLLIFFPNFNRLYGFEASTIILFLIG
jgi:hypothetical protein